MENELLNVVKDVMKCFIGRMSTVFLSVSTGRKEIYALRVYKSINTNF
jgi:hypothetical protein